MSESHASSVTVTVKTPSGKIADQVVLCTVSWTVGRLKEHLSTVYPKNPEVSQQRIIFSGRLLQDDQILGDVIKQVSSAETVLDVYLVVESLSNAQSSSSQSSPADGLDRRPPPDEGQSIEAPSLGTPPSADYQPHTPQFGSAYYGSTYSMPPTPAYIGVQQQYLWMLQQQAYAQSFLHYMQQYQYGSFQPYPMFGQPPNQISPMYGQFSGHVSPMPGQPVDQNFPVNNRAEIAAAGPNPLVQQAAGDDGEGADLHQRGWLSNILAVVNIAVVLSMFGFHVSPFKLLIFLAFVTVCIYSHNRKRRAAAAAAARQQTQEAGEGAATSDGSEPETVNLVAERRPSKFQVAWSTFLLFFTSLLPDCPPIVNMD